MWCARAGANFQSHQPTKCHWEMVQWIPSYCRDSDRVRECAGIWVHPTLHWITNQLVTNIGATLKIFLSFVFCESCQLCVTWSIFELNLFVCHQHPGEKWQKFEEYKWSTLKCLTVNDCAGCFEPPWGATLKHHTTKQRVLRAISQHKQQFHSHFGAERTMIQGVFFNWYPPKKLKYGKPRLVESTLT